MTSEQEARDIQQAIQNSYLPSTSIASSSRGQPVASTSKSTLDGRPFKRIKVEGKVATRKLDEMVMDCQQCTEDMQGLMEVKGLTRSHILDKALRDYERFGSRNRKIDSKLPPKVERWDEGLALYRRGALRMTRTPGRKASRQRNCISLEDLIKPKSMLGMYSNTFFLEFDFLAPLLPILNHPHSTRPVPIFLGQALDFDPLLSYACARTGIPLTKDPDKLTSSQQQTLTPMLTQIYQEVIGRNLFAIHPKCTGCSHSKIFVVRYPGYLLVVITSANTMALDMELCDNHWYIQAFPELSPHQISQKKTLKRPPTEFEQILLFHLNELECPSDFLSLLSNYDYSLASDINLVISQPGVVSTQEFDLRSIGRLASLARKLIKEKKRDKVRFEVCCGSLGAMKQSWRENVDWLLRGKDLGQLEEKLKEKQRATSLKNVKAEATERADKKGKKKERRNQVESDRSEAGEWNEEEEEDDEDPAWKIIYPPKEDVKSLGTLGEDIGSNLSSTWNASTWKKAPPSIKKLFHKYKSKERGRLFHEKSILWIDSSAPRSKPPLLFYLGSHNFSAAAWGTPAIYDKSNRKGLKIDNVGNLEIGIVIKGEKIVEMLEKGSEWEDIITYERPVERYEDGDIPWVSPNWAKNKKEGE